MKYKYILITWGTDINLRPVKVFSIHDEIEPFKKQVNDILKLGGRCVNDIVFAGRIDTVWEFKPVEVVTKYEWSELG